MSTEYRVEFDAKAADISPWGHVSMDFGHDEARAREAYDNAAERAELGQLVRDIKLLSREAPGWNVIRRINGNLEVE